MSEAIKKKRKGGKTARIPDHIREKIRAARASGTRVVDLVSQFDASEGTIYAILAEGKKRKVSRVERANEALVLQTKSTPLVLLKSFITQLREMCPQAASLYVDFQQGTARFTTVDVTEFRVD